MNHITEMLKAVEQGDQQAAGDLLTLVYDELRQLAGARLTNEANPSIQATELVHEAYLRLFGGKQPDFENRAHFFGAASEAMRRVLVDRARCRLAEKRGANSKQVELDLNKGVNEREDQQLLCLQDSLERLQNQSPEKSKIVVLRFFAGLSIREAAEVLGISTATADRQWRFARAWLKRDMQRQEQ